MKWFQPKNRDFIIMVDQSMHKNFIKSAEVASKHIFSKHVKGEDRVCLIKTGLKNYTDTVFSLVEK